MIAETGQFALILALLVSLAQAAIPMVGASRRDLAWMATAKPAALASFALVAWAFLALIECYVVSDFSVLNVAQNSHTAKPLLYKITGVWGNHEGSMLLWVFILALFGAAVALFGRDLPPALKARALSVQAMIATGFLLFILFTSNPFVRLDPAPANGQGLNPLLQDPGLAFHPPCLYLGYVGFSMAFSFAIAALIEGKVDPAWARWVRPWTLAAWSALTLGIALGSWWAYYTLGWGGWWYWDPVENASFMPWLGGTALIHSLVVVEKRDSLKGWTILLAILAFSLSLLGTFLVRSGVLTSVHSFAADPTRGVFVLALLGVVTGGSLLLFAARAPILGAGGWFGAISREGSLLLNNVLLATATGTVLLGTLYPVFADALNIGKISVGPPFFNATFLPLMVPLVAVMAAGPLLAWKRGDFTGAIRGLRSALVVALVLAGLAWFMGEDSPHRLAAAGGLALAGWLFAGTLAEWAGRVRLGRSPLSEALRRARNLPRAAYGMTIAHLGLALLIAGIAGQAGWSEEKIEVMHPGETVAVAGYTITLESVTENVPGPNYSATRAVFQATRHGHPVATLTPEKRQFFQPPRPATDAAIHTDLIGDLYAVIADPDGKGGWVVRLYYHLLVPWIFIGAAIAAAGGVVALSDRRARAARTKSLTAEAEM